MPLASASAQFLTWIRGLIIQEWCCMCKRSGESVDHLFLHCSVAMEHGPWCLVCLGCIGSCPDCDGSVLHLAGAEGAAVLRVLEDDSTLFGLVYMGGT
uniref:Reverse transcriptase zinc-binding domain-containing protein n=1 Tax=Fagus sylvatica TaxID=28930 RepID=A0A2N9GH55_FAGSY